MLETEVEVADEREANEATVVLKSVCLA